MIEWIKKHKVISIICIVIFFIIIAIIIPLILNWIYYLKASCDFFSVGYDISSILEYYGAILTFIGTVSNSLSELHIPEKNG